MSCWRWVCLPGLVQFSLVPQMDRNYPTSVSRCGQTGQLQVWLWAGDVTLALCSIIDQILEHNGTFHTRPFRSTSRDEAGYFRSSLTKEKESDMTVTGRKVGNSFRAQYGSLQGSRVVLLPVTGTNSQCTRTSFKTLSEDLSGGQIITGKFTQLQGRERLPR